jgi:hypothetical protein
MRKRPEFKFSPHKGAEEGHIYLYELRCFENHTARCVYMKLLFQRVRFTMLLSIRMSVFF